MRIRSGLLSCVLLCALLRCGGSGDGAVAISIDNGSLSVVVVSDCPRCDDACDPRSFGRFVFASNVTNQTARDILRVCGFQVAGGHGGQNGDSLQIAGCGGGVELAFVSNNLSAYAVRTGYTGVFNTTIRIGDPLAVVQAADPALVQVDPRTWIRDDGTIRVEANFDDGLRLRELIVGRGFLR